MVISFLYHRYGSMQANRVRHGEKWMSVGNDGMGKLISLYSIGMEVCRQIGSDMERNG